MLIKKEEKMRERVGRDEWEKEKKKEEEEGKVLHFGS